MLVGGSAILELGDDGFIPATIAWMIGDQVGLAFRSRFDMTRLARSKPEVAPQTWQCPDYLKVAKSENSPWAAKWGRMSMSELRQQLEGFLKR